MICCWLSAATGLLACRMIPIPSQAIVCACKSFSSGFKSRETMPMAAVPLRTSLMPRDDPPLCTSIRVPGCCNSKRLPISEAKGAIVLAPVNTSFSDAAFPRGCHANASVNIKVTNWIIPILERMLMLPPAPVMIFLRQIQQAMRHMRAPPFPCGIFVGLRPGRISMDGTEYLVEAQPLLHRQHEFRQKVAGMHADNSDTQDSIFARHSQEFDKPMRRLIGNCTVEVLKAITCYLISDVLLFRFVLR